MGIIIFALAAAATGTTNEPPKKIVVFDPHRFEFCLPNGDPDKKTRSQCKDLADKLRDVDFEIRNLENESNSLLVQCRNTLRKVDAERNGTALSKFKAAFDEVTGRKPGEDGFVRAPSKATWTCDNQSRKALVTLIKKDIENSAGPEQEIDRLKLLQKKAEDTKDILAKANEAKTYASLKRAEYRTQRSKFEKWTSTEQLKTEKKSYLEFATSPTKLPEAYRQKLQIKDEETRSISGEGRNSDLELGEVLESCDPAAAISKADIANDNAIVRKTSNPLFLAQPVMCRRLGEAIAQSAVTWDGDVPVRNPGQLEFKQAITTGKAGSNIELKGKWEFSRIDRSFKPGNFKGKKDFVRRPRAWDLTLGVEGEASGGIANIFGDNPGSGDNLFSLSRLNSKFIMKGALGYNLYPRQSLKQFETERKKFLTEARAACQKSLKDGSTKVATDCEDNNLLAWLYEPNGKKYIRKGLVEKYNKLIWRSSAKYPQFGGGISGSIAFPRREFQNFVGADGKIDTDLINTTLFFGTDEQKKSYTEQFSATAYTLGGYGFYHDPLDRWSWTDGITAVARGIYTRDIPSKLDKGEVELCLNTLTDPAMVTASRIRPNDECRTVLPFEPQLEESIVGELELRFDLMPFFSFPDMGIAPKFSYEWKFDKEDEFRLEIPLYFTAKDDVLTGGIGFAHEVDFSKTTNKAASTVFIFIGKKFSLDGSDQ